eukprot:gene29901-37307_t
MRHPESDPHRFGRAQLIMVFKLQNALKENGLDLESLREAFEEFDLDQNGSISIFEFRIILEKLQITLTNREFMSLWNSIDTDMSGELDWEEFVHIVAENSISENVVQKMDHDMYMDAMENRLGHGEPAPAPFGAAPKLAAGTAMGSHTLQWAHWKTEIFRGKGGDKYELEMEESVGEFSVDEEEK